MATFPVKVLNQGDAGTSTLFGSDDMDVYSNLFNDVDLTGPGKINTEIRWRSGKLKFGDASNNNWTTITSDEQTGNFNLKIPPLAADSVIAIAGTQEFLGIQTMTSDNQRVLKLYRPTSVVGNIVGVEFDHKNASGTQVEFARAAGKVVSNTAGAHDGSFQMFAAKGGTVGLVGDLDGDGKLTIGANQRAVLAETGLTAKRTYTFGNATMGLIGVLLNSGTAVTTQSSASEFDMLNYSVAANTLGANGVLRVRISGYLLQNQASATDFTFKIKFGGTTIYNALTNIVQGAANLPFILEFELGNKNATNVQGLAGSLILNDTGTIGLTTGEGSLENDEISVNANFRAVDGASAKDTTSAQTLQVTMTMSVSNSNVKTSVQRKIIELIPGT